ncbi:MAG: general secretion pathway protein C [Rhodoferax sp.]|nr:general secretion pathway protein C [Rhodoferax sp.]
MASKWVPRILSFAVWAAAAYSASYWVLLHSGTDNTPGVAGSSVATAAPGSADSLERIFGRTAIAPVVLASAPAAPAAPGIDPASRFALTGVVASRGNTGLALLSVDGKAARPFRVGSQVDSSFKLSAVAGRSATLVPDDGGPTVTISLPVSGRLTAEFRPTPALAASAARPMN